MLLHQPLLQLVGSRRRHADQPQRRRACRPLAEDLEPRTLLNIDFYPVNGGLKAVDGGGLKLDSPNVYLLFWGGSYWNSPAGQQLENTVVADTKTILSSGYFLGLTQYHVDGTPHFGGFANDNSTCSSGFTQAALQGKVLNAIFTAGVFPSPSQLADNPIYMVVSPPNVLCNQSGALAGSTITGYHSEVSIPFSGDVIYGLASYAGKASNIDSYTWNLSHEITESITDPISGTGITVGSNEICDAEANQHTYRLGGPGGVLVQSYWSQNDQAFIIPDGSPQTFWVFGGNTLWLLPDQDGSYSDNFIAIGVYDGGLNVQVDGSHLWFDPGTIAISSVVAALTGSNDLIALDQTPAGCSVIIDLEASNGTVWIGSGAYLSGIQSNVTVEFYSSGANVVVDDASDSNSVGWNIQAGSIGWGGAGSITLMGQNGSGNAVTIDGGSGPNNYSVDDGPGAFATTLNTGSSNDNVSVVDSGGGLTVNTGSGTNQVVIGDQGGPGAAGLDGNLTVNGGLGGNTDVTLDDQFDSNSLTWYIQGRSINWGGTGAIDLGGYGEVVTINGGSGSNGYDVDNGPGSFPTTINTGNNNDVVWIFDSAGGLTVNTGSGTTDVAIGGPAGADAGYLDGNVVVSGGSGGTTNVWIYDYQNTTPSTWYYTNRWAYRSGLIVFTTTYAMSGSAYDIVMTNASYIDFWGSSTDTLVYWSPSPIYGLAVTASPGPGSGTAGGLSPSPRAGHTAATWNSSDPGSGSGRAPFIAGATDIDSGIRQDVALESLLDDWSSSASLLTRSRRIADGRGIRTV